jgi:NitT/TauT family transport system substrate-binding protein
MNKTVFALTALFGIGLSSANLAQAASSNTSLTIGLGYIPNVQFAPFYVAETEGFYKAEGLDVTFEHGYTSQLMPLLLSGKLDYVVGDADDVVLARAAGQKVKYVLAMYQRSPVTIFSLADKKISKASDLKGKTVGYAGPYGSSYYALLATLSKNKLTDKDLTTQAIGFTQLESVRSGKVDAAVGFINNEPLVLRRTGVAVNTIDVSAFYPMVGNGMIATDKTLKDTTRVKKVLSATQKGLAFTIKNPQKAFEDSKKYVQNLDAGQLEVLNASIPLMQSATTAKLGLGFSDPIAWSRSVNFLKSSGQAKTTLPSSDFFSNSYLTNGIR